MRPLSTAHPPFSPLNSPPPLHTSPSPPHHPNSLTVTASPFHLTLPLWYVYYMYTCRMMHILQQTHTYTILLVLAYTLLLCLLDQQKHTMSCMYTFCTRMYDSVLHACKVDVLFHLARDDLRGCSAENVTFSHTLQVHFSTGAIQVH